MPPQSGIELRHLRYFLAVFEELHFGRAAERLHIAQPPLSQAIRKLEQELGVEVFKRTSRAVEVTPAGHALAEEARNVLTSFEFAVSEARRVGRQDAPLRIGCVSFMPTARLQRFLAELKKRDGSMRAEVTHLWALEQVNRLRAGLLDLGVFIRSDDYPELECELLFPGEQVHALLPAAHRLAAKPVLTPADFVAETRLTFSRTINPVFQDWFQGLLAEHGYRFRGLHEINAHDPRDALLAVESGLGIVLGPSSLAELVEESLNLISRPLDPVLLLPDTVVAWRVDAPRPLRSKLEAVREAARALHQELVPQEA
jgi:DNA-binding transcriptional LysR family regulator